MAYAVQINGTKSIGVYGPASTAAVSIEIDFKENLPAPDSTAHYVFDGRGGLSYAYLGVNSSNKIFWDVSAVSAFYIDDVLQSWASAVTNFVGSGLDAMAGKTLKIVLTSSTLAGTLLDVGARYTYIQHMQMTVSAIRFLVSDVVTINYLMDEGTGTTLADSLAVAANGSIRNGDGSEWVADGGAGATVSATQAEQNASISASATAPSFTATAVATQLAQIAALSASSAATITTGAFKNNTGTLQAGLTGLRVVVLNPATGATVLNSTGNTTHASTAVLTLSDVALTATETYAVVTLNTAGTAIGAELITAA